MTAANLPCDASDPPDDLARLSLSLELAAERCEDVTPLVYDRFFRAHPAARDYFQLDDLDPRARGRMLAEIIGLLLDSAGGEGYVRPTLATIAADHVSYGVTSLDLYAAFLQALRDTIADLVGAAWTLDIAQAWARQANVFLQGLSAGHGVVSGAQAA